MKSLFTKYLALVVVIILTTCFSWAQTKGLQPDKTTNELILEPNDNSIRHVFNIEISKKDCKNLSKVNNLEKDFLTSSTLIYNNDTLPVNIIELRGKSSMLFKRKSFSVKLNKKNAFVKDGAAHKLKKFNLISLSMDQHYYRNKVAFDLMNQLGLFNLFYDYAEVVVNGKSQGVYLMLQKPKNYAFKKEDATVMLRRDYKNVIKKIYHKGDDTVMKIKCEEEFINIYKKILHKNGKELYDELSEVLDINQYYTWMAFNFLIGNKDYTDEVFFYNKAGGDSIKFGIIPWDYDDIFFDHPREGYVLRQVCFGDRLAFSAEDELDYKLITDDYTYEKYLEVLAEVVEKISTPVLKDIFEQTYKELYPFYSSEEIIKMSKTDKYGKTDLNSFKEDLDQNYKKIIRKKENTANSLSPFLARADIKSKLKNGQVLIPITTSSSTDSLNHNP